MAEEPLTIHAVCPLLAPVYVRPYVLDEEHRRSRWQERVATGHTEALHLTVLLEIATPVAA